MDIEREVQIIAYEIQTGKEEFVKGTRRILALFGVSKSVVCGNCDGWGYTVDENGRRKDHCKECE